MEIIPIGIDQVMVWQNKMCSSPCIGISSVKGSYWLHFFLALLCLASKALLGFLILHFKALAWLKVMALLYTITFANEIY